MSELLGNDRKHTFRELLRRAHAGEPPEELAREYGDFLASLTPAEIAQLEQELVREGVLKREELLKVCDVHMAALRAALERSEPTTPPWHPVHILMEEHKHQLALADELRKLSAEGEAASQKLEELTQELAEAESHYLREENVLFPYLEKHGISEPPAVMWMEHDRIRGLKKRLGGALAAGDFSEVASLALALAETLAAHFAKENKILFPTALRVIGEAEWGAIRAEFDQLGYCCHTPPPPPAGPAQEPAPTPPKGEIQLETGYFSSEELEAILNTLPVDITFVDADDRVRYFNQAADRIFVRSKAVLGRTVQNCHPQKSVHVVNKILADFRARRRDRAEFWIRMGEKLVLIRYFPVWGKDGRYLGTLEVTQDIAPWQGIQGEKRLLDQEG